jgi:flavin-dependent dehydrogenase
MAKTYDLVIVGAGPTGLMAARRAAEKGLQVVILERKKDVSVIRRACCSHFVMDTGYEGEALLVTDGKLVFQRNKFEVCYQGPQLKITDKYFNSPENHTLRFSHQNGQPIGIKFDKGSLLQGLLEECEQLGVERMMGTVAYTARDTKDKIIVNTVNGGIKSTVTALKGIVADGANAHLPESLGMHRERKYYHTALVEKYIVEDINGYKPRSWNFFFGCAFCSHAPIIIGPSLYGDRVVEVTVMGSKNKLPSKIFHLASTDSPLAYLFKGSKVLDKHACSLRTFDSLKVPYKGNVLAAGDAAAFIEVEVQGGLMCGYHAADAVVNELQGNNGFEQYTTWWKKSFEFNGEDYLKVAQGYALVPAYSDDELDYLFSLTEAQILEGTFSQYKTPKVMWNAILTHKERIAREKPDLYKKVCAIDTMSLSQSF